MHPEQRKALMAMSPADKFRRLARLWHSAWSLKEARIRELHPEWTDARVRNSVRQIFLHAHR